jgi:hypothetical protein
MAGCHIMVHQHLDGTISLTYGPHRLGRYSAQGAAITSTQNAAANAVEKTLPPLRRILANESTQEPKADILTCYEQMIYQATRASFVSAVLRWFRVFQRPV